MSDRRNIALSLCYCCNTPVAAGGGFLHQVREERDGFLYCSDVTKCAICEQLNIPLKRPHEQRIALTDFLSNLED
jgi:hypothetical protein